MKRLLFSPLAAVFFAIAAQAAPVTVQESAITPYEVVTINVTGFYNGPVLAGVNKLLVNSVLTDGFCIDPFHFSIPGQQQYNSVSLSSAPKDDHLLSGTHMSGAEALLITKLWTIAYSGIGSNAANAAALQIAMWEVVGGASFQLTSGNDYGAAALLTQAQNYSGPLSTLTALTGPGQDYVIATPVPEGGRTYALLAIGLFVLAATRKFIGKSAQQFA